MHQHATRTFRSLTNRNYRLFFSGQLVSVSGTWMQMVAQSWLVLTLTRSGVALGVTAALQFLPMLLFGVWGGVVADRFDKRRVLMATQTAAGVLAVVLGSVVAAGAAELWIVDVLALLLGAVNVVDLPTRQAFVTEMVGADDVANAIGLNSAVFNVGRLLGPAVGGVVIASVGTAPCFFVNAISYVGVVGGLAAMRSEELHRDARARPGPRQVRAGLRYVWSTPELRSTIVLLALVGTFALNFAVVLPLLARFTLHGGAPLYGTLSAAMAVGSVVGALFSAGRSRPTKALLVWSALAVGALMLLTAAASTAFLAGAALVVTGLAVMIFLATANTTLQLASTPAMRGRVMALYGLVFLGSTPVGGPIVGWVSQQWGARAGLALGGVVSAGAALVVAAAAARRRWPSMGALVETATAEPVEPLPTEAA